MKIVLLLILTLIPQLAAARVYMCVDPGTGKTIFTDKGCKLDAAQEQVRVDPTNFSSGHNRAQPARQKTWNSERDTRMSGIEYNAQRRSKKEAATASAKSGAEYAGS